MDTLSFETLAAVSDAFKQESDLLEEVIKPYKRMLSEIACKGAVSRTGRVPHAIMLVDHPEVYKIIAASRLQQSAAEEVLEWVQKEIWIIVERNYGYVMVYSHNNLEARAYIPVDLGASMESQSSRSKSNTHRWFSDRH